jgi:hypothetical protein
MQSYRLDVATRTDLVDTLGERFQTRFTAGTHTPKSEREELALQHLARLGLAKRVKDKPAATGKKAKTTAPATESPGG